VIVQVKWKMYEKLALLVLYYTRVDHKNFLSFLP